MVGTENDVIFNKIVNRLVIGRHLNKSTFLLRTDEVESEHGTRYWKNPDEIAPTIRY